MWMLFNKQTRFALFALALPVVSYVSAADFRAGVARVDITPPVGHEMGGYSARKGNATGTHDPLFATVIVLENGTQSLALVTADLRSFVSTRVGDLARQKFGITTTIISVSHTHSGPLTWELRSPWYTEAEDKMVDAIGKAHAAMFAATLEFASGGVTLGFNRRKVENGQAKMWWRNEEKLPSHPVDSTLTALIIKDGNAKTRAILVNYACHPSILGPDNLQYSADYPGAMKRYVESQIPGAMCAFIQGGAGDINPYRDKEPMATAFQAVDEAGQQLGKAVVAILPKAKPITGAFQAVSEIREVKSRFKPAEKISIGWTAGVIGNGSFCFATFPGEPFIEHQMTFHDRAECSASMLFGYSYSAGGTWAGYMPTILAAVEGGYGADYNTTVEVGTGEMLVNRAVVKLFELRKLLRELPEAH
jgi:neutral ceramidase